MTARRPSLLFRKLLMVGAAVGAFMLAWKSRPRAEHAISPHAYFTVKRSDFLISVVEEGALKAMNEVTVRSALEGTARVISLVPEGAHVKKGDLLVELDSSDLRDRINSQDVAFQDNLFQYLQAQENVKIQKSVIESNIKQAEVQVEFAESDLEKYQDGDAPRQIKTSEGKISVLEEEIRTAEERFARTLELEKRGNATKSEVEADSLSLKRKKLQLEQNRESLRLLVKYDQPNALRLLESKVQQAKDDLRRLKQRALAEIAQAESDSRTSKSALDLMEASLNLQKRQLGNTKIFAPQDGLVVYAPVSQFGGRGGGIDEGRGRGNRGGGDATAILAGGRGGRGERGGGRGGRGRSGGGSSSGSREGQSLASGSSGSANFSSASPGTSIGSSSASSIGQSTLPASGASSSQTGGSSPGGAGSSSATRSSSSAGSSARLGSSSSSNIRRTGSTTPSSARSPSTSVARTSSSPAQQGLSGAGESPGSGVNNQGSASAFSGGSGNNSSYGSSSTYPGLDTSYQRSSQSSSYNSMDFNPFLSMSSSGVLEEGTIVRQRQELIKLPDVSRMVAEVKIHESRVRQVRPGMMAYVKVETLPGQVFKGSVRKVAILPDSQTSWANPNLKVYATEVLIEDALPELRPGVSARAEVIITNLVKVISVPIQAVAIQQGQRICFVLRGNTTAVVPVTVGWFNDQFIEVTSGLREGDRVLLAPPVESEPDGTEESGTATNEVNAVENQPSRGGAFDSPDGTVNRRERRNGSNTEDVGAGPGTDPSADGARSRRGQRERRGRGADTGNSPDGPAGPKEQ